MSKIKDLRAKQRSALQKMNEIRNDAQAFDAAEREFRNASAELREALDEEHAEQLERSRVVGAADLDKQFRSFVKGAMQGQGVQSVKLERTITSATQMTAAGIPLTIGELVNPLEMGLIYDKVGIKVQTGVRGQLIWPVLTTTAEATVTGENVALTDTTLDFSKITATPHRVGISIKVTNEAINDEAFDLRGTVTEQMQQALARVLNKAVVSGTAVGKLSGPFAGTQDARGSVSFAGAMPTYKELLQMKGKVAGNGVVMAGFCYIMNATTYATLEATPITEGDSRMIIQNGKIAGYPVFETDDAKVADGNVNAGCFAYAVLNQHGDVNLIVDPYTGAKDNVVIFTLNADWSLTPLKYEAFCVGKAHTEG